VVEVDMNRCGGVTSARYAGCQYCRQHFCRTSAKSIIKLRRLLMRSRSSIHLRNYSGDVLNFDAAVEILKAEKVSVAL